MSEPRRAETPPKHARAIHCEMICDRFEQAWRGVRAGTDRPCLDDFLVEASEPERESLLRDLLQVEIDYRRKLGERPARGDYRLRFGVLSVDWLNELLGEPATLPYESVRIASPNMTGRNFGDYQLLTEIARGGMGVVYKARQVSLNRIVALKFILAGSQASDADVLRFRAEAEAAANLDDPGIVPIYEIGQHDGQYFFSMGYVEGQSLATRLVAGPLPPRAAAEIVRLAARAVHYAHQQGVIHRDLKPANILIDRTDRPRVTDFGLAKRLANDSSLTASGQVLGTPSYMPPEQAAGNADQVGPLADVYALGAVLYATLTGRPPFQAATPAATLQQVLDQEPVALGQLNRAVPRDLETITLKCLEKSPHRRYATAAELADDLDRWLTGQTILARRSSAWERAVKWARRRPAVAALSGVLATVAVIAFALVTSLWMSAERSSKSAEAAAGSAKLEAKAANDERKSADDERKKAQRFAARLAFDTAQNLCQAGDVNRGLLWFDYTLSLIPLQDSDLQQVVCANLDAWMRHVVGFKALLPHPQPVELQAFSGNGTLLLTTCRDHCLRIWNVTDGQPATLPIEHSAAILYAAFTPDSNAAHVLTVANDGVARLWLDDFKKQPRKLTHAGVAVTSATFSTSGRQIITASQDGQISLWETTGNLLPKTANTTGPLHVCAFNTHDTLLAIGMDGGRVQLLNAASLELATVQPQIAAKPQGRVRQLAFTASGDRLLAVVEDEKRLGHAHVWEVASGRHLTNLPTRWETATAVVSPHAEMVLTGEAEGVAILWHLDAENREPALLKHDDVVETVAFSPVDGKSLLTGSQDGTARLWDATTLTPLCPPLKHPGSVQHVAFAPRGDVFSTLSQDGSVRLWPLPRVSRNHFPQVGSLMALATSRDGGLIAAVTSSGAIQVRRVSDGSLVWSKPLDSESLVTSSADSNEEQAIWAVAFSSDNQQLLTGGRDAALRVWDLQTGQQTAVLMEHTQRIRSLAMSADGTMVLTGSGDVNGGAARLWNLGDGKQIHPPLVQDEVVRAVAIAPTPTANVCAVASGESTIRLWHNLHFPPAGQGQATGMWASELEKGLVLPVVHRSRIVALAFSPNGMWLASGSTDQTVQLWNVANALPDGKPLEHNSAVWSLAFSRDGRYLLTGCRDGSVRVWDIATRVSVGPNLRVAGDQTIWAVACDQEGQIWSGGDDQMLSRWRLPVPNGDARHTVQLQIQVLTGMEFDSHQTARWLDAATWQQRSQELDRLNAGNPAR